MRVQNILSYLRFTENYHRTIIIRTFKSVPLQNSNSKIFQLRIKLMIKASIKVSSTTITIFCGGFMKKKSDSFFRKSRGGTIFSPFRRLSPVRHQAQRRGSPRDSFKGITPLAFPRQPRRRDWHSRRVLDPFVDRRDTSTRHWTASIRTTNGGQRLAFLSLICSLPNTRERSRSFEISFSNHSKRCTFYYYYFF